MNIPNKMKRGKSLYYPELDGLRFLAFFLVFIHHAPPLITFGFFQPIQNVLTKLNQYGWMGVDLFLCLSAFLFTKLLFTEHTTTGDINVKKFYIRRLLRIWPLYYIFIVLMGFITYITSGWNTMIALRGLGLAVFIEDILAAIFKSYNPFFAAGHLWTISYEEQFYAVIPWFLRRVFRMSRRDKAIVFLVIFGIFTSIRAIMIYLNISHPAIWVLPITHFEAILGGLLIGLGGLDILGRKIPSRLLLLVGILFLILVCKLPNVDHVGWHLMLTYPLVGAGVSLIVYAVMQEDRSHLKNVFQNKVSAYLGKISYGLYVYHILAIYCATLIASRLNILPSRAIAYPITVFITGFCLTVLVSVISYQFLEKPFLRYKAKFTEIQSRPI